MSRTIKILLVKLGLDVHNRGIITVAKILCNEGLEVIYIGNAFPKEIINTAIQESVDIVGLSSLAGAHITLGREVIREAIKNKVKTSMKFVIGGVFPPSDSQELEDIGFDKVFLTDITSNELVNNIKQLI